MKITTRKRNVPSNVKVVVFKWLVAGRHGIVSRDAFVEITIKGSTPELFTNPPVEMGPS